MAKSKSELTTTLLQVDRHINQRDFQAAVSILLTAIEKDPANPVLRALLGSCYGGLNRWDEAAEEYRTALRIDPRGHSNIHVPLATAYFNQGLFDDAVREFKIGLKEYPEDSDGRFLLARIYHRQGRLKEALTEYKTTLLHNPSQESVIHSSLGVLYAQQGHLDTAIQEFIASIELAPNDGETRFLLARCYEESGNTKMAKREYQIAAELGYEAK